MLYVFVQCLFDFRSNKEIHIYFVTHDIPLMLHTVLSVTTPDSFNSHRSLRSYAYLKDLNMLDPQNLRFLWTAEFLPYHGRWAVSQPMHLSGKRLEQVMFINSHVYKCPPSLCCQLSALSSITETTI